MLAFQRPSDRGCAHACPLCHTRDNTLRLQLAHYAEPQLLAYSSTKTNPNLYALTWSEDGSHSNVGSDAEATWADERWDDKKCAPADSCCTLGLDMHEIQGSVCLCSPMNPRADRVGGIKAAPSPSVRDTWRTKRRLCRAKPLPILTYTMSSSQTAGEMQHAPVPLSSSASTPNRAQMKCTAYLSPSRSKRVRLQVRVAIAGGCREDAPPPPPQRERPSHSAPRWSPAGWVQQTHTSRRGWLTVGEGLGGEWRGVFTVEAEGDSSRRACVVCEDRSAHDTQPPLPAPYSAHVLPISELRTLKKYIPQKNKFDLPHNDLYWNFLETKFDWINIVFQLASLSLIAHLMSCHQFHVWSYVLLLSMEQYCLQPVSVWVPWLSFMHLSSAETPNAKCTWDHSFDQRSYSLDQMEIDIDGHRHKDRCRTSET